MNFKTLFSLASGLALAIGAANGAPANDFFANAVVLTGSTVSTSGSNTLATVEVGEPTNGGTSGKTGTNSVWWTWTAPSGGLVLVTNKANFAHLLAIYTGSSVSQLTLVTNGANSANTSIAVSFIPVAGTTYQIAMNGQSGVSGTNLLTLTLLPPPGNDFFTNAYLLTGTSLSTPGSNALATVESGEPTHGGNSGKVGGKSVWWKWVAPSGGLVLITNKASYAHLLAIYTGSSVSDLTLVTNNYNVANATTAVSFNPIEGTTYRIAVDGQSGVSGTNLLTLTLLPPPGNDSFSNAFVLTGTNSSAGGTNIAAIVESGEPNHGATFNKTGGKSIWWTWTAPFTGLVQLTNKANYAHMMAIYTGNTVSGLTLVASATNSANVVAPLSFYPVANTTYQIAVDGQSGASGTNLLTLFLQPTPGNDSFTNAFVLTGTNIVATGTNILGTMEPGETNHGAAFGKTGGRSIWWTWTAPFNAMVQITNKANYAHIIAIYTGNSVSNLTLVASGTNIASKAASILFYPVSGVTYQIAVDGQSAASGTNQLTLFAQPSPGNDLFANAFVLTGTNDMAFGNNVAASLESGEPNHGAEWSRTGGKSIWWRWTAPSTGLASITDTANFDHLLAIYTGNSVSELTLVGSDYYSSNETAEVDFNPTPGTPYWIAVAGQSGASGTNLLTLTLLPPPTNDCFADRVVLSGANVTASGSNLNATKEPGEPNHGGYPGGPSVWWTWTAPAPGGRVTITASGSFYKILAVYTGSSVSALTSVTNQGYFSSGSVFVSFDAIAGTTYQIVVDGRDLYETSSNLTLQITLQAPPSNDNFANAFPLTGTNVAVNSASNLSASLENGEPTHAGRPGGRSVWWSWTAPQSGHFAIVASGYFNKVVGIYTGNSVASLTEVAHAYGAPEDLAQTGFDAIANTVYHIAIDGENGASGSFSFVIQMPPLNDDFADAFSLSGTNISINGTNTYATREAGETNHANVSGGKSLWWSWVAPQAGRVVVKAIPTGLDPILEVSTGSNVTNLTLIANGSSYNPNPAYANFDATQGTAYNIMVDGRYGSSSNFNLQLFYVAAPLNDNFADATLVTNAPQTSTITNPINGNFYVTGSNLGGTRETNEPAMAPASVWWRWTAPANGEILIELDSSFTTMTFPEMAFYEGTTLATLSKVYPLRNVNAYAVNYHDCRFPVKAGTSYYLAIACRGNQGTYTLRGTFEGVPSNDTFANRMPIDDTPTLLQYGLYRYGWNCVASKETGEPFHGGNSYGGKSVWWTWKAPYNGSARIRIEPLRYIFNTMVSVYTGTVVTNLTRITNFYSSWGFSTITFPVTAGTDYQIAIDGGGTYGDSGEYRMELYTTVDITPPIVAITAPYGSQGFYTPSISVSGTSADPAPTGLSYYSSGVKQVEVSVNGGAWQLAGGTTSWSQTVTLTHGLNIISARSTDMMGNQSIASVGVYLGAAISKTQVTDGIFQASFLTEVGKSYQLEWAPSLTPPINWQSVNSGPIIGTGLMQMLSDPDLSVQQRFYRLVIQ